MPGNFALRATSSLFRKAFCRSPIYKNITAKSAKVNGTVDQRSSIAVLILTNTIYLLLSVSSLVKELQEQALDSKIPITDLLRKALVVAKKLEISTLEQWVSDELNGFGKSESTPEYRKVVGSIKVFNPYRGWQSVLFNDPSIPEKLSTRYIGQPIGQLESLVQNKKDDSHLVINFPPELEAKLIAGMNMRLQPVLSIGREQIHGILNAVRDVILNWSLKLEKDGIIGEGMTFSSEEKQKAAGNVYNIGNFTGVLGNVQAETLQIGDYNSIHSELKRLGVSQKERNELEDIFDELKTADAEKKKSLFKRGMEWLSRNAGTIGQFSETIRGWLGTLSGSSS